MDPPFFTQNQRQMNNYRNKLKDGYTALPNDIVNDRTMSAKAKGVLLYLASKPDTWNFFMDDISKHFTDGLTAIKSAVKEIEKAGYLTRIKVKDEETGHFKGYNWILDYRETRRSENPPVGEPNGRVEGGYSNKEGSKNDYSKNEVSNTKQHTNKESVGFDVLEDVIDTWNRLHGTSIRTTPNKFRQLRQRLKTFKIEEIKTAIRNRSESEWIRGEGASHASNWDSLFRNDDQIDKYLNMRRSTDKAPEVERELPKYTPSFSWFDAGGK